uniref:Uncharacterized protein n=1 Tax=Ananas comosus var. bracteatus TaxID=296719 RepID=A0A6V7PK08_ANACO|nr:unnamed protein product [Ananas comosus var. bracteatus]
MGRLRAAVRGQRGADRTAGDDDGHRSGVRRFGCRHVDKRCHDSACHVRGGTAAATEEHVILTAAAAAAAPPQQQLRDVLKKALYLHVTGTQKEMYGPSDRKPTPDNTGLLAAQNASMSSSDADIVVAQDGSGNYKTIGEAVDVLRGGVDGEATTE